MKSSAKLSIAPQPRFGRDERDYVLKVAMKVLKNRDDAEDAAQEAMLRAYRHRDSFRGDAKFTTWLHRVAVTSSLMHLRKLRVELQSGRETIDEHTTVATREPDPEARTIVGAQVARADRHLARMSPIYHHVLRMNAEGYTTREISKKLRLNAATVKTRVHRGQHALRAALAASATGG